MNNELELKALQESREPQTWEYAGALLGYFGVVGDIPAACTVLGIGYFTPPFIKNILLKWHPYPDRWYVWFFTLGLVILLFRLVWKSIPPKPSSEKDNMEEAASYLRRSRVLRTIKSFGLIPLKEWIMDHMGIVIYGTFKRPSDWLHNSKTLSYIDRMTFKSGKGLEYQYAKNFNSIFVREHSDTTNIYGSFTERKPYLHDIKWLLVSSWFFPFWLVVHLLKRPFID